MSIVDWRELYASNRATIERALAGAPTEVAAATRHGALVHLPTGITPGTAVPLVCMLHGCTQEAAGFAAATQMNAAADRHGFAVVYPQQQRSANPNCCWNWFVPEHQARDAGEPARIAGIVRELIDAERAVDLDRERVFVAGLSAGGAMAAVMAATYPDLFGAVAVHSGLPYRAATDMIGAFGAMGGGRPGHGDAGAAVHTAMGVHARPMPAMVVHGGADATVAPVNGQRLLEQFMAANRMADPATCDFDPQRPTTTSQDRSDGGCDYTRSQWTGRDGRLMHESIAVHGLGHAWSGGAQGGSYADPRGPDATEAIWRFFAASASGSAGGRQLAACVQIPRTR